MSRRLYSSPISTRRSRSLSRRASPRAKDPKTAALFTWYFLHNNLGYCLNAQGRFTEAFPHCLAAIRIEPTRYNAFKNLGISLQGSAAPRRAHALRESPADLERVADHIVAAGTPAEAAEALVSCAENLALIGWAAGALQLFARANALLPAADDFVRRYFHARLASCLTRLSRCREAEAHYRESIRLDPWAASAHRGLGVALLAQGDAAAAEREILIAEALSGQPTRRIAACCSG